MSLKLPTPTALGTKALLFYLLMLSAFVATPYSNLFFLLLTFLTVLGACNVVCPVASTGRSINSTIAIGALSPVRKPHFKIRR